MADVQVNKIQPEAESVLLLTHQVDSIYEEIRRRAFQLFESKGASHGYDREHWLEAERSLIFAPPAELLEEEDQFEIRMAVPGFDASQIRVSVLPETIIVDGDSAASTEGRDQKLWFSEFNDRKLLRRFDLPQAVRPYTAKAAIKNGVLQIAVRKAAQGNDRMERSAGAGS